MATDDYEDVTKYTLEPEDLERLFKEQNECTFMWSTKDGAPVGCIMSYVWQDGKVWATATKQRARIPALRRDPRSCVVVTSTGTSMGPKCVTMRGRCRILEDAETKNWFYPALAERLIPDNPAQQRGFVKMLNSPHRVVMEFTPERYITFDGDKMAADSGGGLGMSHMD